MGSSAPGLIVSLHRQPLPFSLCTSAFVQSGLYYMMEAYPHIVSVQGCLC